MDAHFASANGAGLSMCRICAVMLAEPEHVEISRSLHQLNVFVSSRDAESGLSLSAVANVLQVMQCRRVSLRVDYCTPPGFSWDAVLMGKKQGSFHDYEYCFSLGTSQKPLL